MDHEPPPSENAVDRGRAFERQVLPHLDAAYNLARWMLRQSQDAEDVVQDACLRAFNAFDGYAGGDAKSWLLAIVRNLCLTRLKKQAGSKVVPLDVVLGDGRSEDGEGTYDADVFAGPEEQRPDRQLLEKSEQQRVRRALMQLPEMFREVIVLREFEEMSYAEIAIIVGVPTGTVMSRLARARERLRPLLMEDGAGRQVEPKDSALKASAPRGEKSRTET